MIDALFIFGAEYAIYLMAAVAALYFLALPREIKKRLIILAVVVLPVSYIIAKIAGHLYFDPRPFVTGGFTPLISHAADNGFPSDHALLASAIAAVLFPFKKSGRLVLWLFALYIGISRVYVGVHHTIDVIGSIVIAVAVTTVVYYLLKRWFGYSAHGAWH